MGSWAGEAALSRFDPNYERAQQIGGEQIVARQGYAVGAIRVVSGKYVNAVQVQFMRVTAEGQLDTEDTYNSVWFGQPNDSTPVQLGGTGDFVLGVYGRRAAILDAVGLVMASQN